MEDSYPDTTTIPSDPTITAETPIPQHDKTPKPSSGPTLLQRLRFLLLKYLTNAARSTDRNLIRLSKLLSTPSGTDVLLCTTSYTLTLLHALLSRLLEKKLANIATDIAEKADGILLPGETLIATLPAPTSTKVLAQTVGSSKALASTIADYRIFVRMWGLLGMYTWARATYADVLPLDASRKEKILRGLTWAAIASCVGFQTLENGAYLSSKGALTSASWTGDVGKARENTWWIWSSRFWAAYVGVELVRLGVMRFYDSPDPSKTVAVDEDGEKESKIRKEERRRQDKLENWLWWKDLASNVAYAPMTLHWSMEEGLLSDWGVGACGMVAGGALLADAWRRTA
ncbi:Nn.00g102750.m01.CDS01 [Neocucurbitaria sp. VM-36]